MRDIRETSNDYNLSFQERDIQHFGALHPIAGDLVYFTCSSKQEMKTDEEGNLRQVIKRFASNIYPVSLNYRRSDILVNVLEKSIEKIGESDRFHQLYLSSTSVLPYVIRELIGGGMSSYFNAITDFFISVWLSIASSYNRLEIGVKILLDCNIIQSVSYLKHLRIILQSLDPVTALSSIEMLMNRKSRTRHKSQRDKSKKDNHEFDEDKSVDEGSDSIEGEEKTIIVYFLEFILDGVMIMCPNRTAECLPLLDVIIESIFDSIGEENYLVPLVKFFIETIKHQSLHTACRKSQNLCMQINRTLELSSRNKVSFSEMVMDLPSVSSFAKRFGSNDTHSVLLKTGVQPQELEENIVRYLKRISKAISDKLLTSVHFVCAQSSRFDPCIDSDEYDSPFLSINESVVGGDLSIYCKNMSKLTDADTIQPALEGVFALKSYLASMVNPHVIHKGITILTQETISMSNNIRKMLCKKNCDSKIRVHGCFGIDGASIARNGNPILNFVCTPLIFVNNWVYSTSLLPGNLVCIASQSGLKNIGASSTQDKNSILLWGVISYHSRKELNRNLSSPKVPIEILPFIGQHNSAQANHGTDEYDSNLQMVDLIELSQTNPEKIWIIETPIFYQVQKAVINGFIKNVICEDATNTEEDEDEDEKSEEDKDRNSDLQEPKFRFFDEVFRANQTCVQL